MSKRIVQNEEYYVPRSERKEWLQLVWLVNSLFVAMEQVPEISRKDVENLLEKK
ncbi:hypothetical protein [Paenibacillus sp. GCM10012306]|uniref:hypothetical protein n=1 Tax=Paenibacillus sp. GCM10012306 TaxID=3317342 RepID=UPI003609C73F